MQKLASTWGDDFELHLVGHSAGAIILGHMLSAMAARGMSGHIRSLHLYAPACSVQFANRHYTPHADLMQRLYLHILSDRVERNDTVSSVYHKSLLYLVSNALEMDLRTPILGLENAFKPDHKGWDGTSSTVTPCVPGSRRPQCRPVQARAHHGVGYRHRADRLARPTHQSHTWQFRQRHRHPAPDLGAYHRESAGEAGGRFARFLNAGDVCASAARPFGSCTPPWVTRQPGEPREQV